MCSNIARIHKSGITKTNTNFILYLRKRNYIQKNITHINKFKQYIKLHILYSCVFDQLEDH